MKEKAAILVAYFLIYVVWGSTYYFIGVALQGFPPFLLGAIRFAVAGGVLLAICAIRGEQVMRPSLIRRSAVSGIVLLFIDMAVVMLAQRYVSSSLVAIIASSTAVWIMLLDVPRWRQSFRTPTTLAGIIGGFAGVAMLYLEQAGLPEESVHRERGILLLVFGCVSWSLGTLYAKYRSSQVESTNGFGGSAWQMLSASVMFCAGMLLTGEWSAFNPSEVPLSALLSLLYLIVFGSLLAYSAYVWLLKVRPATEVATHAYVNPLIAVLIGAGLGGEEVTVLQLLGLFIILISVMLVNRKRKEA